MKKTTIERLAVRGKEMLKLLPATAVSLWALLWSTPTATAAEIYGEDQSVNVTEVTKLPATSIVDGEATQVMDLYPDMRVDSISQSDVTEVTTQELSQTLESTPESPTKFSVETWVWYTVWWKAVSCTRVVWSGKLFKGTKWETDVFWFVDVDDPMHTKWSWKLTLSKGGIYKWLTLDWDYTFTGTWKNVARFGAWCTVKFWELTCKWKAFLVNSDGSPISFKTSMWMNVWEKWRLDGFIFVNVGPKTYYGEIEYVRKINGWLSLFAEVRLWWSIDGKITSTDSQGVVIWVVVPIK